MNPWSATDTICKCSPSMNNPAIPASMICSVRPSTIASNNPCIITHMRLTITTWMNLFKANGRSLQETRRKETVTLYNPQSNVSIRSLLRQSPSLVRPTTAPNCESLPKWWYMSVIVLIWREILISMWSGEFKIERIFVCVKLKGVLPLPANCQQSAAPIRRHHCYCWASLYSFYVAAQTIIPIEAAVAITDYDVTIVHDFKCGGLVIKLEFVQMPSKSNLILINRVILAYWEKGVAHWME